MGLNRRRILLVHPLGYAAKAAGPKVLWGYVALLWKSPHSWWRFLKGLKGFLAFTRVGTRNLEAKA